MCSTCTYIQCLEDGIASLYRFLCLDSCWSSTASCHMQDASLNVKSHWRNSATKTTWITLTLTSSAMWLSVSGMPRAVTMNYTSLTKLASAHGTMNLTSTLQDYHRWCTRLAVTTLPGVTALMEGYTSAYLSCSTKSLSYWEPSATSLRTPSGALNSWTFLSLATHRMWWHMTTDWRVPARRILVNSILPPCRA